MNRDEKNLADVISDPNTMQRSFHRGLLGVLVLVGDVHFSSYNIKLQLYSLFLCVLCVSFNV